MKIATSFLAALLFTGALGSINTAMSADGVISKDELATGSYCHEKFTPMTRQTLDADNPVLIIRGYHRLLWAVQRESRWERSNPRSRARNPASFYDDYEF